MGNIFLFGFMGLYALIVLHDVIEDMKDEDSERSDCHV